MNHTGDNNVPPSATDGVHSQGAERRQLTVMFCDLVGSTALSHAIDPEDLSEVLHAYQTVAGEVIARYGGTINRFMGDGIMTLFGYPTAREDAAARAAHAAIEIVDAIVQLDSDRRFGPEVSLAVRIGIATGLTVVGEVIGEGAAREEAVVGETPNLAARLQALAGRNEIAISADTRALIGDWFECSSLGRHELKGFSEPIEVWRLLGARDPLALMDAVETRDEPPIVNREHERALLVRLWQHSQSGVGQIVVLDGEAGIGKSRLTRALRTMIVEQRGAWLRLQCLPYFANTSLYPVANRLAQLAGLNRGDSDAIKLDKLRRAFSSLLPADRERSLRALADVLDIDVAAAGLVPGPQMDASRRKAIMLETLSDLVVAMSRQRPIAAVLEDAHWMDPTTGELLMQIADRIDDERVMIVVTRRPTVELPLPEDGRTTLLELGRLHPLEGRSILEGVLKGHELASETVDAIVERTGGVPLYLEELARAVADGHQQIDERAVPISLKDSLMARIDSLGSAKPLAQLAAVIGQQFSRSLLQAVAELPEALLEGGINRLADAGVLMASGGGRLGDELGFRHALVRDAAYESLLKRRREAVHARVADVLSMRFSDVATARPELVAEHLSQAARFEEAATRWIDAGRRAAERSANREAVHHLERAREAIGCVRDAGLSDRLELERLNVLGPALIAIEGPGASSVSEIYEQALGVCQRVPESEQHFVALWGWWRVSMNHEVGRARARQLEVLAARLDDPALSLQAHHCQWATAFHLGEQRACMQHVERGLALYDEQAHRHQAAVYGGHDARVCGEGEQALSLWIQGREADGAAPIARALDWARGLNHVGSIAHAMDYAVIHAVYRRDLPEVARLADELRAFATAQGLPDYVMRAEFFEAWADAWNGDARSALSNMQRAVGALAETGTREDFPMFYELMVQIMSRLGRHQDAIRALLASFRESKRSGIRFWLAEQHRCRAEIALITGEDDPQPAAEQAITVAARQGAVAFELRALMTLARIHEHRGQRARAAEVLGERLGALTHGIGGRELAEARALLEELAGS